MKYALASIQCLIFLSFLFHSYIIMTPAIDEFGFFGLSVHVILASISWMLFNLTKELYKDDKNE
jgi:hypothetical protein